MKNILVTGGAGYIGSHAVRALLRHGCGVTVVDNLSKGHREAVPAAAGFIKADISAGAALGRIFKENKFYAVMHFAAFSEVAESVENPAKYYENNVSGSIALLKAMLENGVKKMVFSSTAAVFGNPEYTPIDEKHPANPINPYGATKAAVERVLADFRAAYGFDYISLRYFNAAGAAADASIGESHNPESHLIPLVLKAVKGETGGISVFGTDYETRDGTCIRDYIHVEDLADAHVLALDRLESFSGCINLGTSAGTSVLEIIKAAERATGRKCPVEYKGRRNGDPPVLVASNALAGQILGWHPSRGIEDMLETAWAWERQRKF
jgi:UDP-glucose 4-epimerase